MVFRIPSNAGLSGVVVELLDASDVVVATTTTDAGGAYQFAASTGTEYRLRFTAPAGYDFSPAHVGTNDAQDSDADPAHRHYAVV